jgi:hypothetical protein
MRRGLTRALPAYAALGLVASGVALATYAVAGTVGGGRAAQAHATAAKPASQPPSANEFARMFVGVTNEYGKNRADTAHLRNVDCVQASPGHYMCSYAVTRPGRARECHVMQARWTPSRASTITVTLAGRSGRCGSLREALASLE